MSYLIKRSVDECLHIINTLSRVCSQLGGPLSLQLCNLVRDGRLQEVIDFNFDYTWAFTASDFLYARQIQALLNKQDFIDLGINKEAVAMSKFDESELLCQETNKRLENLASLDSDVSVVLHHTERKIAKILGPLPDLDSFDYSFGPGATTSTNSLEANPRIKLSSSLECSMNLVPIVHHVLENMAMYSIHHATAETEESFTVGVDIVPGKLAFVPKNCKTHRSIVVEPVLNGLIQKAIGKTMKKRLKIAGMDLHDQTRNQDLARKGSLSGNLATIDLSSASDTVSRGIVWSLLPYDWACLLDECRSPVVKYKDRVIELEKFSSMGNAYTFELETLIFYSLTLSTCKYLNVEPTDVSVYGDDIICPVEVYPLLVKVLEACGFVVNSAKTFAEGPFRESCGADFFSGLDIRPFYLHNIIDGRTLFNMHNWFVRHFEFELATAVLLFIPEPIRLWGPDGYGDGHLVGDHVLRTSRTRIRNGYGGGVFDTYTLKPRRFNKCRSGDYVYPAYSIYVRGEDDKLKNLFVPLSPSDGDVVRGTRGYAKISIYTLAAGIFDSCPRDAYDEKCRINQRMFEIANS
jgi:hypothetical protein